MKKFIAIYMVPNETTDALMKSTTPEQMKEMNESWNAWTEKHKQSLIDVGTPVGKNLRVTSEGVKKERNEVTGYSIVQANSHEEAAKIFQDNPQLDTPGSYIDILEFVDMSSMK